MGNKLCLDIFFKIFINDDQNASVENLVKVCLVPHMLQVSFGSLV